MFSTTSGPIATFIVRISRGPRGRWRGTVERVRTGEKERVVDAAEVGAAIERMLRRDHRSARRPGRPRAKP